MADAINRSNDLDFDTVVKALSETKDYQGITGTTNFTPDNTLMDNNYILLEVRNGKFTFVP